MDTSSFTVPIYFDYLATFLFAFSGALIAGRRGFDFIGVLAIALVSSTGGGLIRDGLFIQNGPPLLVRSSTYLAVICAAIIVALLFGRHVQRILIFTKTIVVVDTISLGMYGVVGSNLALAAGIGYLGSMLVGVTNAVGGGILRDALLGREQTLFKPGTLTATAALIGCGTLLVLRAYSELPHRLINWLAIILVCLIRSISIVFGIRTRSLDRLTGGSECES